MLEQQTTLGLVDVGKHGTGQLLCVPQRVVGHRTPAEHLFEDLNVVLCGELILPRFKHILIRRSHREAGRSRSRHHDSAEAKLAQVVAHVFQLRHEFEGRRLEVVDIQISIVDVLLQALEQLERIGSGELLSWLEAELLEDSWGRQPCSRLDEIACGRRERVHGRDELSAPSAICGTSREEEAAVRAKFAGPLDECVLRDGESSQPICRVERRCRV
mmetsp:Transcript_20669/g.63205  ORF Transcript_20669/g.63205 Transcript_20669/m.63205 type:complete len:216 (-) Transcript_20669:519-1166(-)